MQYFVLPAHCAEALGKISVAGFSDVFTFLASGVRRTGDSGTTRPDELHKGIILIFVALP